MSPFGYKLLQNAQRKTIIQDPNDDNGIVPKNYHQEISLSLVNVLFHSSLNYYSFRLKKKRTSPRIRMSERPSCTFFVSDRNQVSTWYEDRWDVMVSKDESRSKEMSNGTIEHYKFPVRFSKLGSKS